MSTQAELFLPQRPTDEILRERLADAVERANATTDSAERVELHGEIQRLRRVLSLPTEAASDGR